MHVRLLFASLVLSGAVDAASIQQTSTCPHDAQESCRWEISARSFRGPTGRVVQMDWEKLVVTRHWEKPLSHNLRCNVDRDFDPQGGGFLKVWFVGQAKACDAMAGNPADCGVTFQLEDPAQLFSAHGFTVMAPAGKRLARVELFNTLNLQCGNFGRPDILRLKWKPVIGWSARLPGDGTYRSGLPAKAN